MDSITITVFLFVLLISCFVTFFAVKAILKKDLIGTLKISPDKKEKLYRHKKAVVMIAKTVMTVYVVTAMIFIIVPGILDVPRVFTGNYERKLCRCTIPGPNRRNWMRSGRPGSRWGSMSAAPNWNLWYLTAHMRRVNSIWSAIFRI